jgi:hypothetical protein
VIIFEQPPHRFLELRRANALAVRLFREQCGRIGSGRLVAGVAVLRVEPLKQGKENLTSLRVGRVLVESGQLCNRDKKSVLPNDIDRSADLAIICFLALQRAHVFIHGAIFGMEIKSGSDRV